MLVEVWKASYGRINRRGIHKLGKVQAFSRTALKEGFGNGLLL